ncbi:MAG: alpha/beta fold hydrolase [Pseudomonadota bacterium]
MSAGPAGPVAVTRRFSGQREAAVAPIDSVELPESQAALRQMSLERLMAYGVHHADAIELRGRVATGEQWQEVAADLAETCLAPPEFSVSPESDATRANRLFRAAALLRMSQMMMVDNTPERSEIFAAAGKLYEQAAAITGDRRRLNIETVEGVVTGWFFTARAPVVGRVAIIGGIEGWAMDFDHLAEPLAQRGVETLLLDGPGQGESRMVHGTYLTHNWPAVYGAVFDALAAMSPAMPLGMIGNSMGGAFAMHLARTDHRIAALCNNGGSPEPGVDLGESTMSRKMRAHTGLTSFVDSRQVWASAVPIDADAPVPCPLLVVQGGRDPIITAEAAQAMFEAGSSEDRHLVTFDDGDHCIYNHADDKTALIGDWMASRLKSAHRADH